MRARVPSGSSPGFSRVSVLGISRGSPPSGSCFPVACGAQRDHVSQAVCAVLGLSYRNRPQSSRF